MLELARDRFEDATYAFEAHHHNQEKVRRILEKYLVKDVQVPKDTLDKYPELTSEDSFYYVLRQRVNKYLKTVGGPGPTE
jgi:cytochrome b involved in lipid metabolism